LGELVDTHCHLDFDRFDPDRDQIVSRAKAAGLRRILNPGIDVESSRSTLRLAEKYECVYAAVGMHPNSSLLWDTGSRKELEAMAAHPKVVAIGEIGLDYYRDRAPWEVQRKVFREQLSIAKMAEMPVIIHCRQAGEDAIEILTEWYEDLISSKSVLAENPGVFHSFSEDVDFAREVLSINFRIGITGPITFEKADKLHRVVQKIPLDRLLVETDAPFLTPHPFRGKRNEPSYVRYVVEKIAELRSSDIKSISRATAKNADILFHW
jgi:TatD DNase family protein